jgi:hypothetical protein
MKIILAVGIGFILGIITAYVIPFLLITRALHGNRP